MLSLAKHKRDWEDLGRVDPLWAVLTDPERRFGKWDTEAFFASSMPEQRVRSLVEAAGGKVLSVERLNNIDQIYCVARQVPG